MLTRVSILTRALAVSAGLALSLPACAVRTAPVAPAPPAPASPAPAAIPMAEPPAALRFVEGPWESIDPANRWQMNVRWNPAAGTFEGVLTRNGGLSADVGFTTGEVVWKGTPTPEGLLREDQMLRHGGNGVSQGHEWVNGLVDLTQSGPDQLVTPTSTFVRPQ